MPGLHKDCVGNNPQGQTGRRGAVKTGIHMAYVEGLGYGWGIERVSIGVYRGGPRLPEFLSFSNLVETCRTFQMLYGSMC